MLAPSLIIQNLTYQYEKSFLFKDLSYIFQGGLFHCILGPSGVGKTTLLKLIANLDPGLNKLNSSIKLVPSPTETSLPHNISISDQISWMGQKDILLPWLTIIENVLLGYTLRHKKNLEQKHKALELLDNLGLKKWAKHYPYQLSGGMRQRVALARALLENRPVLLMDEPFSSLDAIQRFNIQTLTSPLLKNKTVLMVTHDPQEALRLADQIHILSGFPASFVKTFKPAGAPPRDSSDPECVIHYSELINILRSSAL
jgi:putative hydroxymethylpyrimidine transport system ATP-binding protein